MKSLKSFFGFFLFLITFSSYSQLDCKILKNVKLRYADAPNRTDYVVIKDNKHIEYLEDGKYFIKSDLNWINECEYIATMIEVTLPDFPFKPGEIMKVKFQKIENGIVYGTAIIREQSYGVKFELMK